METAVAILIFVSSLVDTDKLEAPMVVAIGASSFLLNNDITLLLKLHKQFHTICDLRLNGTMAAFS